MEGKRENILGIVNGIIIILNILEMVGRIVFVRTHPTMKIS